MQYEEYIFSLTPHSSDAADVLAALLAECGFESFDNDSQTLKAYAQRPASACDETLAEAVDEAVATLSQMMSVTAKYTHRPAANANWNAVWEQEGFQPIVIGDRLVVHSTSHSDTPPCTYNITINPCMAFGTGTHATTRMLLTWLLDHSEEGLTVVDAGCGTGILGILALLRGASSLYAYDIDEWSVENTKANLALNNVAGDVVLGDSSALTAFAERRSADLLIANINRNILLGDMPHFAAVLKSGGSLLLSGFYKSDVEALVSRAGECGLETVSERSSDEWTLLHLRRL